MTQLVDFLLVLIEAGLALISFAVSQIKATSKSWHIFS